MPQDKPTTPILRHADGTAVTAQEAYDAFMNTRVLIVINGITYEATGMEWNDINLTQDDPTKVAYVGLYYVGGTSDAATLKTIQIGDTPIVLE